MTRRLLLTAAALAIVLAGCGDDDDTEGATAQDSTTTAGETTTTAADDPYGAGGSTTTAGTTDAGGSAVAIADFTFDPATIEVPAGTTVTWANQDGVGHTVTSGTPESPEDTFDEAVDSGGEAEVTFDDAGTFAYFCAIHPSMTGEVVVS